MNVLEGPLRVHHFHVRGAYEMQLMRPLYFLSHSEKPQQSLVPTEILVIPTIHLFCVAKWRLKKKNPVKRGNVLIIVLNRNVLLINVS